MCRKSVCAGREGGRGVQGLASGSGKGEAAGRTRDGIGGVVVRKSEAHVAAY